jgi:hypothetical protein
MSDQNTSIHDAILYHLTPLYPQGYGFRYTDDKRTEGDILTVRRDGLRTYKTADGSLQSTFRVIEGTGGMTAGRWELCDGTIWRSGMWDDKRHEGKRVTDHSLVEGGVAWIWTEDEEGKLVGKLECSRVEGTDKSIFAELLSWVVG